MLNEKQALFVEEYLTNGFNATQAYLKVYGEVRNPRANAYQIKNHPDVKAAIQRRLDEMVGDKAEIASKVLAQLNDMAFSDKNDEIYTPTVKLKAIDLLQKQLALQTQKMETNGTIDINVNIEE